MWRLNHEYEKKRVEKQNKTKQQQQNNNNNKDDAWNKLVSNVQPFLPNDNKLLGYKKSSYFFW